jgi:hypothetical protein
MEEEEDDDDDDDDDVCVDDDVLVDYDDDDDDDNDNDDDDDDDDDPPTARGSGSWMLRVWVCARCCGRAGQPAELRPAQAGGEHGALLPPGLLHDGLAPPPNQPCRS